MVGESDFDIAEFIMTFGTLKSYLDARGARDSDLKGKVALTEDDIRRCSRCLVTWHLSTPTALGTFKLNHLLNERYFERYFMSAITGLRPSPLTLSIFSVFDPSSGSTLRGDCNLMCCNYV